MLNYIMEEATKALLVVIRLYLNVIVSTVSAVLWGLFLTKTGIVTYVDTTSNKS